MFPTGCCAQQAIFKRFAAEQIYDSNKRGASVAHYQNAKDDHRHHAQHEG